eukprot:jgi/Tetstr1/447424/TSEL_034857.t1
METLALSSNSLSGTLPPEWSTFGPIKHMSLSFMSGLSGSLPPEWSKWHSLAELDISNSNLRGSIPGVWSELYSLTDLDLSNNNLTGSIPEAMVLAKSPHTLNVANNKLFEDLNTTAIRETIPLRWVAFPQDSDVALPDTDLRGLVSDRGGVAEEEGPPWTAEQPPSGSSEFPGAVGEAERLPEGNGKAGGDAMLIGAVAGGVMALMAAVAGAVILRHVRRSAVVTPSYSEDRALSNDILSLAPISWDAMENGSIMLPPRRGGGAERLSPVAPANQAALRRLLSLELRANPRLADLAASVIDLHEGMPMSYKTMPLRLLRVKYLLAMDYLPCYEEASDARHSYLEIPYSETTDELWATTGVVSWRWSAPKPEAFQRGYSPMSALQFAMLKRSVSGWEREHLEYVWVDWACVPQYSASPMLEIARSKVYYGRARTMLVVPQASPLPEGFPRVVLGGIIRELQEQSAESQDALVADVALRLLRADGVQYASDYFGRVWTLAERISRHGRGERLKHWIPLDVWLGMTFNVAWECSSPDDAADEAGKQLEHEFYWNKLLDGPAALTGIEALRLIRRTGSSLVSASASRDCAQLFISAVESWRERAVTEEVNVPWLRRYLTEEAVAIYRSWDVRDSVWAIFSFFCWKIRDAEQFQEAHRDLCMVAQISERETRLWSALDLSLPTDSGDESVVGADNMMREELDNINEAVLGGLRN